MSHRLFLFAVCFVFAGPFSVNAQSLISKLPVDGTWARYDAVFKTLKNDGTTDEFTGTITIRSVGEENDEEQGIERLRWLELEQDMNFMGGKIKIIDKILVPEKEFGADKNPVSSLRRMWRFHSQSKEGEPRCVELNSAEARTLEVFLPPPLDNPKELDPREFKTAAGEFSCSGRTGEREQTDESHGGKYHRTFEVYSNEDAPFGTVSFTNETKTSHSGKPGSTMGGTFTLKEVGANAKSSLPNNN